MLQVLRGYYASHEYVTIIGLAALLFSVELFFILVVVEPFGDVINFYNQAELVKSGMVPYSDFVFEFPPFAMLFFLIPSVFTSDQNTYAYIFGIMMVLMALVCLYYLMKIADRIGISKVLVAGVFIALILIYEADIVRKFDAIPMTLTVMAIYYHIERRTALAYGLSVFGAFVKIYPIILSLLFLVLDLADRRDGRPSRILKGLASCLFVAVLAFAPFLIVGVPIHDVLSFFSFQGDRGFQVESLVGVVIQGLGLLGITSYSLVPMYNTWDVVGPIADALSTHWNLIVVVVLLVLVASIAVRAFRHGSRGTTPRDLTLYALLLVATFVILNKVFSTQYMLWLFPLLALLPVTFGPNLDRKMLAAVLSTDILSMVIFALYNPGEIEFVIVNLARDAVILSIVVLVVIYVLTGGGYIERLSGRCCTGTESAEELGFSTQQH